MKANCAPVSAQMLFREYYGRQGPGPSPARREAGVVDSPPRTLQTGEPLSAGRAGGGRRRPWIPRGVDPMKTSPAGTWDRDLPRRRTRGGAARSTSSAREGGRRRGVAPHPSPHPGASITREVPQHRPVGPEAQDLLHRQVDHGVVTPLRLHLPRGAPAAFSSGAGGRQLV